MTPDPDLAQPGAATRAVDEDEPSRRLEPEPLDPQLTSIQPGGGVCMRIELAWGYVRRFWLRTFRPGYVRRMKELRRGDQNGAPHEVLDPRDLKFYRNQPGFWWAPEDDPFAWRDRLPLVRVGLAEVLLLSAVFLGLAGLVALWTPWAAIPPLVLWMEVLWFFRNPRRVAPAGAGLVVSPADGKVVSVTDCHDDFLGGPTVEVGIFLSVFDVHVNRAPVSCRLIGLTYRRGKFLNALLAASARENERLTLRLQESEAPYRRFVVRQIAGAIARRIVCWSAPGAELARGEAFGMIKLGSRTELILPRGPDLEVLVRPGQRVSAGTTVLARYVPEGG
jgi:phosphatidylserine decarboxylase